MQLVRADLLGRLESLQEIGLRVGIEGRGIGGEIRLRLVQRPAGGLVAGGLVDVTVGLSLLSLHEDDRDNDDDYQHAEHQYSGHDPTDDGS